MNKKAMSTGNIIAIVLIIILFIVIGTLLIIIFKNKSPDNPYSGTGYKIINPVLNLSTEEAIEQFDESFIFYVLYSIKAYNLHPPPLSSDKPKIEFHIGDDTIYNAIIDEGSIIVSKIQSQKKTLFL